MVTRRSALIGGGALAVTAGAATLFELKRMGSMDEYNEAAARIRATLKRNPESLDYVRFATLAASGHNTQPWHFHLRDNTITIYPDLTRRTPVVDPDDHHLFISLGCAAENLSLAATANGQSGELRFEQSDGGSLAFAFGRGAAGPSSLCSAIPARQSTRSEYHGATIRASDMTALTAAATIPGVDVVILTGREQRRQVRDLVTAGNSAQMADKAFVSELKSWLRFSPRDAAERGDGLFSAASGNPALPKWLGPPLFDRVFKADAENKKYARHIDSSPALVVFVAQREDPEHWVLVGRACQRFALQATALGIRHAFINQPAEVAALRPTLARLIGLPNRRPDLVMRFGYGPLLPYSARRPIQETILR